MATLRKRKGKWQVQVRRQGQPALSKIFILQAGARSWARTVEAGIDRGEALVAPVAELKPPANGKPRNRRLSRDEGGRVEAAPKKLRSPGMQALMRFALQTGMRRGELVKCE
ncbi:hypothetical protein OSTOST_09110 [Ostertagia ostertagi]